MSRSALAGVLICALLSCPAEAHASSRAIETGLELTTPEGVRRVGLREAQDLLRVPAVKVLVPGRATDVEALG